MCPAHPLSSRGRLDVRWEGPARLGSRWTWGADVEVKGQGHHRGPRATDPLRPSREARNLGAEGWTRCCALISAAGASVPTAPGGETGKGMQRRAVEGPLSRRLGCDLAGQACVCSEEDLTHRTVGPHLLGYCPLVFTPDEWGVGRKMNFLKIVPSEPVRVTERMQPRPAPCGHSDRRPSQVWEQGPPASLSIATP